MLALVTALPGLDFRQARLVAGAKVCEVGFVVGAQLGEAGLVLGQMLGEALLMAGTVRPAFVALDARFLHSKPLFVVSLGEPLFVLALGEAREVLGVDLRQMGFVRGQAAREARLVPRRLRLGLGIFGVMPLMAPGGCRVLLGLTSRFALPMPALGAGEMGVLLGIGARGTLMMVAGCRLVGFFIALMMPAVVPARRVILARLALAMKVPLAMGIAVIGLRILVPMMFCTMGGLGIFVLGVTMEMASVSGSGVALGVKMTA